MLGAWGLLGILILLFVAGFGTDVVSESLLTTTFGLFLLSVVLWVTLSLSLRCPNCGRRFLLELPGEKHAEARKITGLTFWATVVIDVLRNKNFVCMYCGKRWYLFTEHGH
jgi:uncharacterized Zn-finger protein